MASDDGDPLETGQPPDGNAHRARLPIQTVRELYEVHSRELLAFLVGVLRDGHAADEVAAAVRLTFILQVAVADSPVVPAFATNPPRVLPDATVHSFKTTPRGSWLVLAGATTAAAVLLAAMSLGPASSPSTQLARVDRSASELVSLWRTGSAVAELDIDDADVELAESGTEVAVPDWLFAAVSLEQSNAAGNSTDERQEN